MDQTSLQARYRAVSPKWLTLYYTEPLEIVGGQGRRVIDAQGRRYLDFFANGRTNILGYNAPEIADVITRELPKAELHTSTPYINRRETELAERIARLSGIPDAKVCFAHSGSVASKRQVVQYRRA
ncbi:hypothetical protein VR41_14060 [Streptomyces sp. NRRL B-1568]|nr:hypothetical protein VR41_14060 [Streptomyces sp. NRRL B-1568]